ncbi:MAG TPA: hypothetical protein VD861_01250 [Pyrinomonadaceae bacterium]|nr:hypothetical protein [Pyrinomonadaceae bacterium]
MRRINVVLWLCCFVLGSGLAFGQKTSRKNSKKPPCSVGDITFACPEGFKSLPAVPDPKVALFFHKEYGLGLFVAAPDPGFDERKYASGVAQIALGKFFPKESQSYSWRPLNYSDTVSKHEAGGGMLKGFNGNSAVIVKYRRVKADGKDFLVGYAAEIERGKEAKRFFEGEGYADSMPGCNASVEIIYSVTGEKVDEDNFPCVIVTPAPGLN